MPSRDVLVDSGILYAIYDTDDAYHNRALSLVENVDYIFHIPYPALIEAGYLALRGGKQAKTRFLKLVKQGNLPFVPATEADYEKALDIAEKYGDQNFDVFDCLLMAMSERLRIQQIATVDRNHFTIYRPEFTTHLIILPEEI